MANIVRLLEAILAMVLGVQYALPYLLEYAFQEQFKVHDTGAILITGTSSGIGHATCGYLAETFPAIKFYCGLRKLPNGTKSEFPFPYSRPNVEPILLDITKDDEIQQAAASIQNSGIPLVGLINNAAVFKHGTPIEFTSLEEFKSVFEVNLFGTYRVTQVLLPLLRASRGRIVMIGSVAGTVGGVPLTSAYQGTKSALESLTDSLRQELWVHGMSVSIIEPGMVESEITKRMIGRQGKDNNETCDVNDEMQQFYPTLTSDNYLQLTGEVYKGCGDTKETLEAIEHALMAEYPRTRYMTSRIGALSASQFSAVCRFLPDRVNDWLVLHGIGLIVGAQRLRNHVETTIQAVL